MSQICFTKYIPVTKSWSKQLKLNEFLAHAVTETGWHIGTGGAHLPTKTRLYMLWPMAPQCTCQAMSVAKC